MPQSVLLDLVISLDGMQAHRFNTATFDRPTEALTGIDLGGRIRMKGIMILQPRSVRRDASDSPVADAPLSADVSTAHLLLGLSLNPENRLTSLFADLLNEDLLPSAAKRPAKQEDEDADDEDEEDDDAEEEGAEEEEEEGDEEDDEEEEEDDDEEEEEDEFDDPDSGFDDDDDDDEEDFDDDE